MRGIISGRRFSDAFIPICIMVAAFFLIRTAIDLSVVPVNTTMKEYCLVIDPGHGGIDGGAVAFNGIKESDINLSIGWKLKSLADFYGVKAILTRSDDSSPTDAVQYSEHEDLVHRTDLINAVPNGVLISIHQNFYLTSQPSGAQVLYAASEESRRLGEITQGNLVKELQQGNRRLAEPASPKLYITSHVECPAVLVECGFLSNLSELDLLVQDSYQLKIAEILLASFLSFTKAELHS